MIRKPNVITTFANGRERYAHGTGRFPCAAFRGALSDFLGGTVARHWHDDFEFFTLDSGKAIATTTSGAIELGAADLLVVNAGAVHSIAPTSGELCAFRSIVCAPSVLAGERGSVFRSRYIDPVVASGQTAWVFRTDSHPASLDSFDEAFRAFEDEPVGYELLVRSGLSRILASVFAEFGSAPKRGSSSQQRCLRHMLDWISDVYSRPVNIEEIAAAGGVTPRECQRIVSALLGETPSQVLLERRISAAQGMLAFGDAPISEVASGCGFSDPGYFSKQFRRVCGVSPREYRASARRDA